MKTICPACGATNSLESLLTDAESRLFVEAFSKLPQQIMPHILRYLALFRPHSGRVLQWKKAKRLIEELKNDIDVGHIQQKGKVARPCSPFIWASALEKILELEIRSLPLKNHNYLKTIVYDIADDTDREKEYRHNQHGRNQSFGAERKESELERVKATPEMFKNIRAQIHKNGRKA